MEDEFYNLTVKGNDLKPYVRRFQELAVICPSMVPNTEKLLEAFIGGLPRSIEGNVTASKPQTLEEAINISQRLMDQGIMQINAQKEITGPQESTLRDKLASVHLNNSRGYSNCHQLYEGSSETHFISLKIPNTKLLSLSSKILPRDT
ncbi:hypothetical protein Tco_0368654 [Tanacetum coccineum]